MEDEKFEENLKLILGNCEIKEKLQKTMDGKFPYKEPDMEKYKELVLHIIHSLGENFSFIKLCHILWEIDGSMYVKKGKSITGDTYIKQKVVPLPVYLMEVILELEYEGRLGCICNEHKESSEECKK